MATITDDLILNIAQPLRQFDELERSLDESVTSARNLTREMDRTEDSVGRAANFARDFEARLQEAERSASQLATETASMALSAGRAEGDFREVAQALGISETSARQLATQVLDAQAAATRLQDASMATARSLGLSDEEARRFAVSMDRAARETRSASDAAGTLDNRFASIRSSVVGLVAGFGAFAAVRGIFRGLDDLVDSFVEFDQAITQSLAIVSNVTPEIREQFEAVARTVSESLRFSATEAGEAFFFLASAGFDVNQQLALLPQVAEFAQAGMFDLSTATTLLADSTSALGLRSKDSVVSLRNLTRVADVLTKANILSNAEVQQFAEALTNDAAAAARLVGVEVEEVVATLAVFADQGQKGAAAGTAFAIVLRDLQRAALEEPQAFEELGIAVFDAAGEFRPMADIVAELERAFDGMSDAQRRASITALGFQDRSIQNLLTLLGTSEAIRDYTTQLQAAGGATEDLANRQLLSLGARLDIARQKFENVKIELGEALVPAIEAFLAILPAVVAEVSDLGPALEGVARAAADAAPKLADMATQFLRFVEAVPRSVAILGDLGQIAGDIGNIGRSLVVGVAALGSGVFPQVANEANLLADAIGRIRENSQNIQFGRLEQGLVDSIREGRDEVLALGDALIELDEGEGGASLSKIDQLARTAGVSGANLNIVLRGLVGRAKELGLSAPQVNVFTEALANMGAQSVRDMQNFREFDQSLSQTAAAFEGAAARIAASGSPIDTFFREVDAALENTELSFTEFILSTTGAADEFLQLLTPAQQISVTLRAVTADSEAASEIFRSNLAPSIGSVTAALEDLNKDGSLSVDEFITSLEESALAFLSFQTNLATIGKTAPGLAAELKKLPIGVGAVLAQQLIDETRIAEAELARTVPTELADTIDALVTEAIGLLQTDPSRVAEFAASVVDVPGAAEAIESNVNAALGIAFDRLVIPDIDLTDTGRDSASSYAHGFQEELARRRDDIADAVESVTRNALQMDSPSKLMLSLGAQAGASLIAGFVQAANRPIPVLTGMQIGGASAGAGSGGTSNVLNVANNIYNPVARDILSESSRLEQLTGAVTANLRGF